MDTFKNKTAWYGNGTSEALRYFNGTVLNSTCCSDSSITLDCIISFITAAKYTMIILDE